MNSKVLVFAFILLLLVSCHQNEEHRTVICIPVYGQSLALGEEAERITNFDSLANYAGGRIVTENMDHNFGYFDNDNLKQWIKKITKYQKRSFELSIYNMAKILADHTGQDTLICIFPGGRGATTIANLSKGTPPYQKFIEDIKNAYNKATKRGWTFRIPAICWMQGESDIVDYPKTNYKQQLIQFWTDVNKDIHSITQQLDTIPFICYQANSLSRAKHFKANEFECRETAVPMTFVRLLQSNDHFWASGPTYPYHCIEDKIHIDALGQQSIGALAARSILSIMRGDKRFRGLIPKSARTDDKNVIIHFDIPIPPLVIDTTQVAKSKNYGFSVINKNNLNIAVNTIVKGDSVKIICSEPTVGSMVRYAVNGEYMKSGNTHGPRGNLRDSQGNWCYQFDVKADSLSK